MKPSTFQTLIHEHRTGVISRSNLQKYPMTSLMMIRSFLLLCCCMVFTNAQSTCSCSPLQYRMMLNLSSTCPPTNVNSGNSSGIEQLECFVTSGDSDVNPVIVTSYFIAELNLDLEPVRVKNVQNVTLVSGDNVTFMSTTFSEPDFVSGGIQVLMKGRNAGSEIVTLQFLVVFSNLCDTPPFFVGDSIGWMIFLRGMPTRPDTCYTNQPTSSPIIPSMKPTMNPTMIASVEPTLISTPGKKSSKSKKVVKKGPSKKGKSHKKARRIL